jgi:hypothetical protein
MSLSPTRQAIAINGGAGGKCGHTRDSCKSEERPNTFMERGVVADKQPILHK